MSAAAKPAVSELILSDRLITLAKDADRAGYTDTAEHLLTLACSVFGDGPARQGRPLNPPSIPIVGITVAVPAT
jgi:hypothetical protein